jgi:UDP-N-acetylmuramoylalanine--D-glutamate ligase
MSLDLTGKRILILGLARSGLGAAKLAVRLGGSVLISDRKPKDALARAIEELHGLNVEIETGGHQRASNERFDLAILSPGVVPPPPMEESWQRSGIPVWSELEFAAAVCENPWIAVTGSNGKTTTVNLIHAILKEAGLDAVMAGNIGAAWSDFLPAPKTRVFVIEVSSFQLEYAVALHPQVAVLLNIYENHLDRHGTLDVYANLKYRLFRNQTAKDAAVLNGDDEHVMRMPTGGRKILFGNSQESDYWTDGRNLSFKTDGQSEILLPRSEFPLQGRHNELNALAAAAAAHAFGAPLKAIRTALKKAQAVEHRIEYVTEHAGVAYYNDSKSTNMVATMTALDSFEKNVILLFGGRPKKESFRPLSDRFGKPLKALIVFGEAVAKVRDDLPTGTARTEVANIEEALQAARRIAKPGDTILLSPGCTSFDQFNNFEERGRIFKSLVMQA